MEHLHKQLADAAGFSDIPSAQKFASTHGFTMDTTTAGLQKVQRLAAALAANPKIINPALPFPQQSAYWAVLYKHAHLLTFTLLDLSLPARVEPMQI